MNQNHHVLSQSPSLRGSGRFVDATEPIPAGIMSQSPSLRGSGRFQEPSSSSLRPFVSQSPSLRGSGRFGSFAEPYQEALMSQSPSLRGSGRFGSSGWTTTGRARGLNPLHCGAVVASPCLALVAGMGSQVSIPFIAGQWSLPDLAESRVDIVRVSIPFIAGQWSLLSG